MFSPDLLTTWSTQLADRWAPTFAEFSFEGVEQSPAMLIFVAVSAMLVSVVLIPLMIRLAPWLGMVDAPNERKVHLAPIPRVGGIGIVVGALIPIALLLGSDPLVQCYLFGALVLFLFGAWDDRNESGHFFKFIGQFLAVVPLVWYGGLRVEHLPLLDSVTLPAAVAIPFTVVAMVGVINGVNHADGLDGLAAGEVLLSLIVIAFLAYLAGGSITLLIAMAVIGGILGFLRFNSHPAQVFMGDNGSQFLGFTLAFLAVRLTQYTNSALSPAVVALLIGLPVIDILGVFYLRAASGNNWFKASKNHIHHRLLGLGFTHHETVVVIYSIQALFVFGGWCLAYEPDGLILLLYVAAFAGIYAALTLLERGGWRVGQNGKGGFFPHWLDRGLVRNLFRRGAVAVILLLIPLYLVLVPALLTTVPRDFALVAAELAVVLLAEMLFVRRRPSILARGVVYIAALFSAYLYQEHSIPLFNGLIWPSWLFYGVLAVASGVAIRYSYEINFRTTPTDFLGLFLVLAVALLQFSGAVESGFMLLAVKFLVILYGCELLAMRARSQRNLLNFSALGGLTILAVRGLLP